MKRYIITALCAFIVCRAWGQLNAPCFTIDIPENTPALYNNIPLTIDEDSTVIELDDTPIYALAVTGQVEMHTANNSMARIILVDNYGTEYLVYEVNSLLTDTNRVSFENVGRETLWQDMIFASHLVVRLTNATVTMNIPTLVTELLEQSSPTIKRARTMAQNDTIVNVLNRNLIARDIPWRAGRTEISDLEYTDRKLLLGNNSPLHNIEYYTAGYYVDPTVEEELNNPTTYTSGPIEDVIEEMKEKFEEILKYPNEFDWRNRHGKDWTTLARDQKKCNSCWAFATVAALESYVNIYYNQKLDLDLSEQELVACMKGTCDIGDNLFNPMNYIYQNGIVGEKDLAYDLQNIDCSEKAPNSQIHIRPEQFFYCPVDAFYNPIASLRSLLIKRPISVAIDSLQHALLFVGYKLITESDRLYIYENYELAEKIDPKYVNQTSWTVKNSWGLTWGTYGFGNIILSERLLAQCASPWGKIISKGHNDSDIVCSDADNDGYYFWGIGDKPAHCPVWASDIPDGDDSDPMYGAMDEYGHLDSIDPDFKETKIIVTNTTWSTPQVISSDLSIPSGVTLTVTSYLTMHPDAQILIQGGRLIIDGGTIRNGYIRNKGSLIIKGGGVVEMCGDDSYEHNPQDLQVTNNGNAPFAITSNLQEGGFKRVNR